MSTTISTDAGAPCGKCGKAVVEAKKTAATSVVLEQVIGSAGGNYGVDRHADGSLYAVGLTVHQARMRVRAGFHVWIEHRDHCVGGRR